MRNYWIAKRSIKATSHSIQVLAKHANWVFESAIIIKTKIDDELGFSTIDSNLIQYITSHQQSMSLNNLPIKLSGIEMVLVSFDPVRKRISKTTLADIRLTFYHKNSAGILSVLIKSPDVPYASIIP